MMIKMTKISSKKEFSLKIYDSCRSFFKNFSRIFLDFSEFFMNLFDFFGFLDIL